MLATLPLFLRLLQLLPSALWNATAEEICCCSFRTGLPPKSDQGLQQGGTFVFKGRKAVFEHYDESTGAHANFADVMAAAGCPPA